MISSNHTSVKVSGGTPLLCFSSRNLADDLFEAAAVVFAVALLSAGQTASITATLAGQIVSEGFLEWRVSVCCFLGYLSYAS